MHANTDKKLDGTGEKLKFLKDQVAILVSSTSRKKWDFTNYFQDFIDFRELRNIFAEYHLDLYTSPCQSNSISNIYGKYHGQLWLLKTLITKKNQELPGLQRLHNSLTMVYDLL